MSNNSQRRILLVDDEVEVRSVLNDTFKPENYIIDQAEDGAAAVSILKNNPAPNLILCDISMPKMSGLEFLAELKTKGLSYIPVVMLTAHSETHRLQEALRLGAFDYIIKPFDLKQLREVVYKGMEIGKKQIEKHERFQRNEFDASWEKSNQRSIDWLTLKNNQKRASNS